MSSGSAPASANSTPSSWAGSVSSDTAPEQQGLWSGIRLWWAEFSLQTKLLAIATLVVSLMMTSITFFALNGIQRDAVMNDTRYARDLGLLLAGNVTELVQTDMTENWPMWPNSFGVQAAAFATSFLLIPKALFTSAFPSVGMTPIPEVTYVLIDVLNSPVN